MNKSMQIFRKITLPVALIAVIAITGTLSLLPRKTEVARSENCEEQAPEKAQLNVFPVTWATQAGVGCTDFAAIAVRNAAETNYAPSTSALPGEELYVRIYVHNGAKQGLEEEDTTACNVHGYISLTGSTISTSFAGSGGSGENCTNTNVVNGNVSVNLPAGSSLEIIPGSAEFFGYQANTISSNEYGQGLSTSLNTTGGTFNMGDMKACFEYSKFLRFRVRVAVSAATPAAGTINATVGSQNCPNTYNGVVSWSSTNVISTLVHMDDISDSEPYQTLSTNPNGSANVQFNPSHDYLFIIYDNSSGNPTELARKNLSIPALNCGGGPTSSGWVSANVGTQNCPSGVWNGSVTWSSTNVSSVLMHIDDLDDTQPFQNLGNNPNGSVNFNFIPSHDYLLIIYNNSTGNPVELNRTEVNVQALSCGGGSCPSNTGATLTASTPIRNGSVFSTTLTWNSTGSHQVRLVQINPGSSTETALTTGSNSGSFVVNNLQPASVYTFRIYDATCNTLLNSVIVTIPSISSPTQLICVPNVTSANVFETVVFTASGGSGSYTWSISGEPGNTGSGTSFSRFFTTPGTKVIFVTSNGQTNSCSVVINGQTTNQGGNCTNNATNSCNNNTNNNNQGGNNGNNNSNQNNNTNINGNNNTVTNTNNNCVNNSCNYNYTNNNQGFPVYVYQQQYQPTPPPPQVQSAGISYSKRAHNETKNADATTVVASREDFITYTLTATNTGGVPHNSFVITDDLSQVLPYADMVDNGGGYLSGNVISFPGITIPAGASVSKSFKVRVKFVLASNLSYTMTNTYGNTVTVKINNPQVLGAFVAPKTGAETASISFAGMLTVAALGFRHRKYLLKLIFA